MSDLPELRFLDEAARAAGCGSWMHIIQMCAELSSLGRSIVEHAKTLQKLAELEAENAWRPIGEARKDRTVYWTKIHDDLYPSIRPERPDLERWNGVQIPIRHSGVADDGFDVGWTLAAPVGQGGFPDEWFVGFRPLPSPPKGDVA